MSTGKLYLVATPIGNLGDITYRALKTLEEVDLIACEDTRHTLKLLNHFNISKPLTSYYEHNRIEKGRVLVEDMKNGKNIALVTDAGTPAISDPGEDLVKLCMENGVDVVPVPGAVALINALIISGMDTGRFSFEGFLSVNKKSRLEHLEEVKNDTRTLIFYEAPHKLVRTLEDFLQYFGDRNISLVRELTKMHEECRKTTISKALEYYTDIQPKGEFVLVVEGKSREEIVNEERAEFSEMTIIEHVDKLIADGMTKKDAQKEVARLRGISKRDVYNEYLNK